MEKAVEVNKQRKCLNLLLHHHHHHHLTRTTIPTATILARTLTISHNQPFFEGCFHTRARYLFSFLWFWPI
jgi:hypothetical protein